MPSGEVGVLIKHARQSTCKEEVLAIKNHQSMFSFFSLLINYLSDFKKRLKNENEDVKW